MRIFLKSLGLCTLLALAAPSQAQVRLDIHIGPPSPPREVIVVSPYAGAVWVGGYQRYDAGIGNYVWVPGSWQRPPRQNVVWVAPRYVNRGDHYDYYQGRWGNPGKHKGQIKQAQRAQQFREQGGDQGNGHGNGKGHGKGHGHDE